jgi:hypothetical protein
VSPSRDNAMEAPFATMYQAFFTFACIGKYHDTYVPIKPRDRQEIFLAQYFNCERHIPILVSLAYDRLVAEGVPPSEALLPKDGQTAGSPVSHSVWDHVGSPQGPWRQLPKKRHGFKDRRHQHGD